MSIIQHDSAYVAGNSERVVVSCDFCGTSLTVYPDDIGGMSVIVTYARRKGWKLSRYIRCPSCKQIPLPICKLMRDKQWDLSTKQERFRANVQSNLRHILPMPSAFILSFLYVKPSMEVKEFSRFLGITRNYVHGALTRLVNERYVTLTKVGPRMFQVSFDEDGRAMVRARLQQKHTVLVSPMNFFGVLEEKTT